MVFQEFRHSRMLLKRGWTVGGYVLVGYVECKHILMSSQDDNLYLSQSVGHFLLFSLVIYQAISS